jgi:P27 family predicted phage terminase small subunit
VTKRDNFKQGHLEQLTILCKLYQEYNKLQKEIETEGYFFESEGRYGTQIKTHPLVTIRDKVLAEIRQYSKLLGLVLEKDKDTGGDEGKGEWK